VLRDAQHSNRGPKLSAGKLQTLLFDETLGELALQGVDSLLVRCD